MKNNDTFGSRHWKQDKKGGFEISSSDLEKQKLAFKKRGGKVTKLDAQKIDQHYVVISKIRNLDAAGYGL